MMEDEEYPSDSEQSDDDYNPEDKDSEEASEIDSDGEPENDAVDESAETKPKGKKRKAARNGSKAKRTKLDEEKQLEEADENNVDGDDDDDGDKKRADALWADFLNGTDSGPSETSSKPTNSKKNETVTATNDAKAPANKQATPPPKKVTVKEIFEFAGEKVEVEKEVKAIDKIADRKSTPGPVPPAAQARSGGGLSSILGQIGKKNKLSVLEKTKLDWTGFKKNEGIEEELQVHNKGRDGFLERQDFLERTDFRRFEIEKNLRQVTRRK